MILKQFKSFRQFLEPFKSSQNVSKAVQNLQCSIEAVQNVLYNPSFILPFPRRWAGPRGHLSTTHSLIDDNSGHSHRTCPTVSSSCSHILHRGVSTRGVSLVDRGQSEILLLNVGFPSHRQIFLRRQLPRLTQGDPGKTASFDSIPEEPNQ